MFVRFVNFGVSIDDVLINRVMLKLKRKGVVSVQCHELFRQKKSEFLFGIIYQAMYNSEYKSCSNEFFIHTHILFYVY